MLNLNEIQKEFDAGLTGIKDLMIPCQFPGQNRFAKPGRISGKYRDKIVILKTLSRE